MADNMGGIVQCWCALLEDVRDCTVLDDGLVMRFKEGRNWMELPATSGRTDVQVSPVDEGMGEYEAAVSLSVPSYKVQGLLNGLNGRCVLFKYRTANGKLFVVGDKENFLRATVRRLSPSSASGYTGAELNLAGTLSHPELPPL